MKKLRDWIINRLGGFTPGEFNRYSDDAQRRQKGLAVENGVLGEENVALRRKLAECRDHNQKMHERDARLEILAAARLRAIEGSLRHVKQIEECLKEEGV